ncbi:MAG: alpha-L-fucosidase [Lachnospiraceae bacterium]|nr:alpha-L-fucosidase [Lachnospiraceae bacterium]
MTLQENMQKIEEIIAQGPYQDDWISLQNHTIPDWFTQSRFGIFIHWGVYSVPAFANEWYPRNMYRIGTPEFEHHVKEHGPQDIFGYQDFIPLFKAENFVPESWVRLIQESGARYIVPVAEHHDGFQMYQSSLSHWNAFEMGPHRDIIKELRQESEKENLVFGVSSHRAEHWFYFGPGRDFDSDIKEPLTRNDLYWPAMPGGESPSISCQPEPHREFLEDWLVRTCELIDLHRPKLLYFDWWIEHQAFKPYLKKLAAYYYNRATEWKEQVVICYKHDAFVFGSALFDIERGQCSEAKTFPWQTDTSVSLNSWCYTNKNQYRKASEIICDLIDIVSKNGNLLLNIGPKADGTITEKEVSILHEIGNWLKINGEAVYGTRPWRKYGEGPTPVIDGHFSDHIKKEFTSADIRYTVKGEYLYATVLQCSSEGEYHFTLLSDLGADSQYKGLIESIELLGSPEQCIWKRDKTALHISLKIQSDYPIVFKIKMG